MTEFPSHRFGVGDVDSKVPLIWFCGDGAGKEHLVIPEIKEVSRAKIQMGS